MQKDENLPIDAVITWVDGNDPLHKAKMENYLENKNSMNSRSVRMRYGQVNEIEFSVKSILKYAQFVRNIFIVTDNQTPDFLKDSINASKEFPNVFIVDHKVIFEGYEQFLPTFNSRSIATMLHRIPNLSECFLVFNDDFLLLNEVKKEDFFINNSPVVRGKWESFDEDRILKKIKNLYLKKRNKKNINKAGHFKAQQLIARKLGFKRFFKTHHVPFPTKITPIKTFFEANKDDFLNNIKHKFRHQTQFLPESLMNHLELKNKTAVTTKKHQLAYFQSYKKPLFWIKYKLNKAVKNNNVLFLCMQSLDQCPPKKLAYIKLWLKNKYD